MRVERVSAERKRGGPAVKGERDAYGRAGHGAERKPSVREARISRERNDYRKAPTGSTTLSRRTAGKRCAPAEQGRVLCMGAGWTTGRETGRSSALAARTGAAAGSGVGVGRFPLLASRRSGLTVRVAGGSGGSCDRAAASTAISASHTQTGGKRALGRTVSIPSTKWVSAKGWRYHGRAPGSGRRDPA